MTHPAHHGDPLQPDTDHCGYGWAHGRDGCEQPATIHLLVVEPTYTGTSRACDNHADAIRDVASRIEDEHPFRRWCARFPHTWNVDPVTGRSWCSP